MKLGCCEVCNTPCSIQCERCKLARYCSKQHQTSDWKRHRMMCRPFSELALTYSPTDFIHPTKPSIPGHCVNKPFQDGYVGMEREAVYGMMIDAFLFSNIYDMKPAGMTNMMVLKQIRSPQSMSNNTLFTPTGLLDGFHKCYPLNPCSYPSSWDPNTDHPAAVAQLKALHRAKGAGQPYRFDLKFGEWFKEKDDKYVLRMLEYLEMSYGKSCTCKRKRGAEKMLKGWEKRVGMEMMEDMIGSGNGGNEEWTDEEVE